MEGIRRMRDYLMLGPTPYEEPCCQVGKSSSKMMMLETMAFCRQLKDLLAKQFTEVKVEVKPKREEHEFGSYYQAAVYYEEDDKEAVDQAFWLENNTPENWSDNVKHLLQSFGYSVDNNNEPAPFVMDLMTNG
jgi:hypothetical protein